LGAIFATFKSLSSYKLSSNVRLFLRKTKFDI